MPLTCSRCGHTAEPPPPKRVVFKTPGARDRVLSSICAECFEQWEGIEIRAINEYHLNLVDPEDRRQLESAALDYLFGAEDDQSAG